MAGEKKETIVPAVDMAGLMEMISAMGDDEMLTVEIVHESPDAEPGKGGGHGE